jgi:hypothetical protein
MPFSDPYQIGGAEELACTPQPPSRHGRPPLWFDHVGARPWSCSASFTAPLAPRRGDQLTRFRLFRRPLEPHRRQLVVLLHAFAQGLTLVHFSAQRKRLLWKRGCVVCCLGGVWGVLVGVQGVRRVYLCSRNGSGCAEKWTSVSPCLCPPREGTPG